MYPRWFYSLMIAGYLANICATIPHIHPPGAPSPPHIHTNWLMGVEMDHHSNPSHDHNHAHEAHGPVAFPSAERPDPQHDHDCVFLAASGIAIAAVKTMPPDGSGAVAGLLADVAAAAPLGATLRQAASTQDLAGAAAPHCARFLTLRVLRI